MTPVASSVVPLSVLDLAPVAEGSDNGTALAHTTALASRVEELGYHRLWVAEHHNMPGIASSAPAVLLAHLAARTSSIRLGSGGVMLPNHAPLVVAEQFGTLVALHPDRIDLGIGRAPGTDQLTALALRRSVEGLSAEDFPQELARLIGYFESGSGQPRVTAVPGRGDAPEIWLLGSSDFSARLAGRLGLPFSFTHHFSAANTDLALELYRAEFRPSRWLSEPYAMVAVSAVCADTDERAEYLSLPSGLAFLRLRQGRPGRMWNKALSDGTLLAWPSAIWAPGVLTGNAPGTKGLWTMAPLPQWSAGENRTGNWGGSSTGVTRSSKHKAEAAKFAVWMNTDPAATTTLVKESGIYPAARDAQNGPALKQPPAFFEQQESFYVDAKAIAETAAPFVWGPNVNVTYSTYKDAFGKAIAQRSPFGGAVDAMQEATVADMRKSGFKLAG